MVSSKITVLTTHKIREFFPRYRRYQFKIQLKHESHSKKHEKNYRIIKLLLAITLIEMIGLIISRYRRVVSFLYPFNGDSDSKKQLNTFRPEDWFDLSAIQKQV